MNKNDKKFLGIFLFICVIFLLAIVGFSFYLNNSNKKKYQKAQEYFNSEEYSEAQKLFSELGEYKDSIDMGAEANKYAQDINKKVKVYDEAQDDFNKGKYENALDKFESIADFNDSADKIKETKYYLAKQYYDNEDYDRSKQLFEELKEYDDIDSYLKKILDDYKSIDSYLDEIEIKKLTQLKEDIYNKACELSEEKKYKEALEKFNSILDYRDSEDKAKECENELQRRLTTISAGLHFSVCLRSDNKLICTDNRYKFEDWDNIVSISYLDNIAIGLKEDGTVISEGHRTSLNSNDICDVDVSKWKNIIQIDAGQQHVVGLTNDGNVLTTGLDEYTENGNKLSVVNTWKDIQYIATGWSHIVGLDLNGKIHIAGKDSQNQKNKISENNNDNNSKNDWTDIIAISAAGGIDNKPGHGHTVGLRKDGTVVAVGSTECSQCDVEDWEDIVAISAGDWHTVGLRKDGTVVSTRPTKEQLEKEKLSSDSACRVDNWTDIVAISAGRGFTLGLKSDGSIVSTGNTDEGKKPDENDDNWKNIKIYNGWDILTNQNIK